MESPKQNRCIAQGLGYALTEEVRFTTGRILDRNFDTDELPRFSWMPAVETAILHSPGVPALVIGPPSPRRRIHNRGFRLCRLPGGE